MTHGWILEVLVYLVGIVTGTLLRDRYWHSRLKVKDSWLAPMTAPYSGDSGEWRSSYDTPFERDTAHTQSNENTVRNQMKIIRRKRRLL